MNFTCTVLITDQTSNVFFPLVSSFLDEKNWMLFFSMSVNDLTRSSFVIERQSCSEYLQFKLWYNIDIAIVVVALIPSILWLEIIEIIGSARLRFTRPPSIPFFFDRKRIRFIRIRFHIEQTWSLILKLSTRWTHYDQPIKNSTEISVFICIRMRQSTTNLRLSRIDGMHRSEANDGKEWKWIRFPLHVDMVYVTFTAAKFVCVEFTFAFLFLAFFLLSLLFACPLHFHTDVLFFHVFASRLIYNTNTNNTLLAFHVVA